RVNHQQGGLLEFSDAIETTTGCIESTSLVDACGTHNRYLSVYELRSDCEAVTEKVVVTELTMNQVDRLIYAETTHTDTEYCLHLTNEGCDTQDEAEFIANIRLQEQQTYRTRFQGATGIPVLTPGFVLNIDCNGHEERILITEVQHRANNLDTQTRAAASSDGDYYEAIFVGIPADHQYRPAYSQQLRPRVISTTARVHAASFEEGSENSHRMIAERNEQGLYRVVFDFMLGKGDPRASNWMRLARPTARTNHFDMPLTPGTEVQVAFIDGNPDRPYIQCALENIVSLPVPVTSANSHHAAIHTDGMLKTEALKSRQSLHISGEYDAKDVKDFVFNPDEEFDALTINGVSSGEKINRLSGKAHIQERYGDQYIRQYGADFIYGVNATYRFGQKYEEVHANIDPATNRYSMGVGGEVFNLNEKLLGSDNTLETGEAYTNHQRLNKEQRNGIIRKEFGNKYSYHKGIESTWVEGADSAVQPSYHYGKRHVEYHADLNAGPANMCPAEISESIEGLTTHKYGDVAE